MTIEALYQLYLQHPYVQTDTRKIREGELFFALKGAHFNGNLFALEALQRGAAAAIVDEPVGYGNERIIQVPDVLTTLQDLAGYHRRQFSIPFLAITGSNGKTTTKELIHAVLSKKYRTYTTEGNLNNHIGIPLTILKVRPDAEMAVIEMGANHQQEIAGYCRYTRPTHGLITNVGKAHLEGFGGIEGVKKGKGELFDYIRKAGGTIFLNTDTLYLQEMSRGIANKFTYGTREGAVTGERVESEPFLQVQIKSHPGIGAIRTRLVGDYNVPNVLAAVAVGVYFGVAEADIRNAIESYTPTNSRSQLLEIGSNHVILDAYNANPSSMKMAIENFARLHAPHKVLFLGAMAELGAESEQEHKALIDTVQQYPWHLVVLVGDEFAKIKHPFLQFSNSLEAANWLKNNPLENCYLLIKGSRSTQMEQMMEALVAK